jgi:hypothetical protein
LLVKLAELCAGFVDQFQSVITVLQPPQGALKAVLNAVSSLIYTT